jgi:uncharacterized membrane protein
MAALEITLVVATLLCSLVAGLVFGFAVIVMPGIATLKDREFLRAFQVVDGVIQRGQPLFGLVWLGSAAAVLIAIVLGVGRLDGSDRLLLLVAGLSYLLGVQLPTLVVNVPLNNEVHKLDLDSTDDDASRSARERFERRWNRWNIVRTAVATLVSTALTVLLLRI